MRLLLVEDEEALAGAIRRGLEKAHYKVDWAEDGTTGFNLACENRYSAIILDVMLPGMDGWTICKRLRTRRDNTPILMLTARDEVEDRVKGLELGADDYLPKPFAFPELRARVAALLRREQMHKSRSIRIGDLEIDTKTRQVRRAGTVVALTPREYDLLEALAAHEGRLISREMILERIWMDDQSNSNTVEVHIASLRRKIDAPFDVKLIHTVHRQGYVLRGPQSEESVPS
ncbi:MAG: response regulator transcription factor [Capsulimonadales bacterium]|nr:response regulator transcription factor [Capsulimonadales bacterium]